MVRVVQDPRHTEVKEKLHKVGTGKKNPLRTAVQGGLLATAELTFLGQVCDRIRIHQQTTSLHRTLKVSQAFKEIYMRGGMKEFYCGYSWNVSAYFLKHSVRWFFLPFFDQYWDSILDSPHIGKNTKATVKPILFGGSFAIFEVLMIKCPTESMKTKSMTRMLREWSAWRRIHQSKGSVLWNGVLSTTVKQAATWISFIGFLDWSNYFFNHYPGIRVPGVPESLHVSIIAGILTVIVVSPFDVCLANVQRDGSSLRDVRYFSSMKYIVKNYGYRRLYSGFTVKCVRSVWYSWVFQYLLIAMRMERTSVKYDG